MVIGIVLGAILGIILLLISSIGFISAKLKHQSHKWPMWTLLAGVLALLTAGSNTLLMLY